MGLEPLPEYDLLYALVVCYVVLERLRVMSENAYAPLSASLVRTLTDKLYEKRKVGALEVEK